MTPRSVDTASACNGVQVYADGLSEALLIVRGDTDAAHAALLSVFTARGARMADLSRERPDGLSPVGTCRIRPSSFEAVLDGAEGFSLSCDWGETSPEWTLAALTSGRVYAGLLHREVFRWSVGQRLALHQPVFPPMPVIRLTAQVV